MTSFYFIVDKSTYSADEVSLVPSYTTAFWVVVDGFTFSDVQAAGEPTVLGNGSFATPGEYVTLNVGTATPQNSALTTPQRIVFPCDVDFNPTTSPAIFPGSKASPTPITITATFTVASEPLTASTVFLLTSGEDPYFLNINPSEGNAFWLSQDLRVFTVTPTPEGGTNPFPPSSALGSLALYPDSLTQLDPLAGFSFIESLLPLLNKNYSDPGGIDPFDSVFPDQSDALTSVSSVIPSVTEAGTVYNSYNFAVARVRLNGASLAAAENVRVFFRVFTTLTNDTDYDPTTTYPSNPVSATDNNPGSPQLGVGGATLPFFATGNYDNDASLNPGMEPGMQQDYSTPNTGTAGVNNQTITIPEGKNAVWAYFGCYLNVYDPNNTFNTQSVEGLLNGGHHCLVAQIAFDDAPITTVNNTTLSPENCDKLAQRNLQYTPVPATPQFRGVGAFRIPQTLDLRSSIAVEGEELLPDELMIDWGQTPIGSTASLYWPQVSASTVTALADEIYSTHQLSAVDANTVQFTVESGLAYVPIPFGTNVRFAGLFTIQIPPGSATTEVQITVRRITTQTSERRLVRGETPWRYITGSFAVRVPTSTPAALLPSEETLLAIMKWRLQLKSPSDRWYPVLLRYISYISDRVNALGGNAAAIPASPSGYNPIAKHHDNTGKVTGLVYDRFGDFEGFHLLTEEGKEEEFWSKEKDMEGLIRFAWEKRAVITVKHHEHHHTHRPTSVILRRLPNHNP